MFEDHVVVWGDYKLDIHPVLNRWAPNKLAWLCSHPLGSDLFPGWESGGSAPTAGVSLWAAAREQLNELKTKPSLFSRAHSGNTFEDQPFLNALKAASPSFVLQLNWYCVSPVLIFADSCLVCSSCMKKTAIPIPPVSVFTVQGAVWHILFGLLPHMLSLKILTSTDTYFKITNLQSRKLRRRKSRERNELLLLFTLWRTHAKPYMQNG